MASFLNSTRRMRVNMNVQSLTKSQQSRNFSSGVNLRPHGWPGPNPYLYVLGSLFVGLIGGWKWKEYQMKDRQYTTAFDNWYKMKSQEEERQYIQEAFEADEEFKNKSPKDRAQVVYNVKRLMDSMPEEFKTSARYQSIYNLWKPYLHEANLYKPNGEEEDEESEESSEEEESTTDEPEETVVSLPAKKSHDQQQATPARDAMVEDSHPVTPSEANTPTKAVQHEAHLSKPDEAASPKRVTAEKPKE
jgi:hypothetical protein